MSDYLFGVLDDLVAVLDSFFCVSDLLVGALSFARVRYWRGLLRIDPQAFEVA